MNRLQNMFGMSDDTYKNLKKAIAACTFTNLSMIAPAVISMQIILEALKTDAQFSQGKMYIYLGLGIAAMFIMFLCAKNDYKKTYPAMYAAAAESRLKAAETIRALPMRIFNSKDLTELTANIMNDCTSLEHTLSHVVPQLFANVITCALVCALIAFFDWRVAMAMFCSLPIAFLIIFLSRARQERLNKIQIEAKLAVSSEVQDYLDGLKIIKTCNLEGEHFTKLKDALVKLKRYSLKMEFTTGVFVMSAQVILQSGIGITIFVAAALFGNGEIGLEGVILSLLIVTRIYTPFIVILTLLPELFYMKQAVRRLRLLSEIPVMKGEIVPIKSCDIAFENVSFKYNDESVLKNISFVIPEKSITALVGVSGSGKSTITKLIARFWDADSGAVKIGGIDVKTLEPEYLMSHMSFVFQEVTLFNNTVYNNIKIGKIDACYDEIIAAAKAAHCDEFVSRLPQGYETVLGKNAMKLSGGERQRISIARALLK
ncbi:MAG: ABC transporter ATP-binding protein/permease, partial [Campylobacteraceae bacterium]|nr:ABC transporter ATP-binding protein/permease [Campylobacteraceae bacterium]